MKNKIIKLLALLLVAIMACSVLVACFDADDEGADGSGANGGGSNGGTNANGEVTTVENEVIPVEKADFEGREFRILATHNVHEPNFELIGEMGTDRLSQAIYERNLAVKDYCNVEIVDVATEETNFESLEMDYDAGSHKYDLVFLIRDEMSSAIQNGYMKDLTKVPNLNLANEWYNPLAIESMTINGRLYHLTSSFSLTDKARTATLFYNRDMAEVYDIKTDVIAEVKAGTWTIDKMYEMIKIVAESGDTDGNGTVDKTDTFGIAGGGSESATAIWAGMGNKLVTFNNGSDYGSEIISERSLNGLDTIKKMFSIYEWAGFTGSEQKLWTKDYNAPHTAFVEERVMFYSASMGSIDSISQEAEFAYTAITYPKYDLNQTRYYATNDNTYASTFGVPYGAADFAFSGYMIELLSWKSHTTTYPEYYQVKCKVQNSYDPVCAEMLQLNYEGLVFDFGFMFSNTVKYKAALEKYTTSKSNTQNMSSLYAGAMETANGNIDIILDQINNNKD